MFGVILQPTCPKLQVICVIATVHLFIVTHLMVMWCQIDVGRSTILMLVVLEFRLMV